MSRGDVVQNWRKLRQVSSTPSGRSVDPTYGYGLKLEENNHDRAR